MILLVTTHSNKISNMSCLGKFNINTIWKLEMAWMLSVLSQTGRSYFQSCQNKITVHFGHDPPSKKNRLVNSQRLVMARQYQKPFNCLNDNLEHDGGENSIASYFLLEQFYEEYFPDQSPMEKFNYYPHDLYADLI